MPAEWEPHERTWMAFPPFNSSMSRYLDNYDIQLSYRAWSTVANKIVEFEPVTILVDTQNVEQAKMWLDPRITIIETDLDGCWMRDIGPTFVRKENGELDAVDWVFNGWGK